MTSKMAPTLVIAGGGIGGLSTALAATRAGWRARVFEQAPVLSEVGAGIQLGPNATRVLRAWGLLDTLVQRASAPGRLVARDALGGRELAAMPLGAAFEQRYGAPYLTVHRADLQAVLLDAARMAGASIHTGARIEPFQDTGERVQLQVAGASIEGHALVGADGLWSAVREQVLHDGPPHASDHVAYRGWVPMADLPASWRTEDVTAWLGPRLHAVTYPVRSGEALNVVCVVQQSVQGDRSGWDLPGAGERLLAAVGHAPAPLYDLLQAVPSWGLWVLHDRSPVAHDGEMARGRIALLGDAAHPMRPYLAQGAAMALEDARAMERSLTSVTAGSAPVPEALRQYALARWERVARVQRRSLRNATIFHATGAVRMARDAALRSVGARLLDVPWLYEG